MPYIIMQFYLNYLILFPIVCACPYAAQLCLDILQVEGVELGQRSQQVIHLIKKYLFCIFDFFYLNSYAITQLFLTILLMGGGGVLSTFFSTIFEAKTRHFQGCLRVCSRGHQVVGTPVIQEIWLYFTMQNKFHKKILFLLLLRMKKGWIESIHHHQI